MFHPRKHPHSEVHAPSFRSARKLARGPALYVNCHDGQSNESRQQFSKFLDHNVKQDVTGFCSSVAELAEKLHQKHSNLNFTVRVLFEEKKQVQKNRSRSRSRDRDRETVRQSQSRHSTRSKSPPHRQPQTQTQPQPRHYHENRPHSGPERMQKRSTRTRTKTKTLEVEGQSILDDPILKGRQFQLKPDTPWFDEEEEDDEKEDQQRKKRVVKRFSKRRPWTKEPPKSLLASQEELAKGLNAVSIK